MHFVWIILVLLTLAAFVDFAYRRFASRRIQKIFENVPPFVIVPAERTPDAVELRIPASDGLTLSGSLFVPLCDHPRSLVIFFPPLNGSHWMAPRYCQAILDDGHAVLGFDFRNQGESDDQDGYSPIHWITEFEMADAAAVLEFVESHPKLSRLPLAAFGVSRGGAAALVAACRYPGIRSVIADSAYGTTSMTKRFVRRFGRYVIPERAFNLLPDWHIDQTLRQAVGLSETARNCRYVHVEQECLHRDPDTPVLLISGGRDSYVTADVAMDLAACFGGDDCLWVVEKARHNMARSVLQQEYDERIVRHITRSMNQPASSEVSPGGQRISSHNRAAAAS
ncbi:MAG: alpha/beta fold hydrolase [Planctomycetaceae bacterium]